MKIKINRATLGLTAVVLAASNLSFSAAADEATSILYSPDMVDARSDGLLMSA